MPHVNVNEFSHLRGLQLADTFDSDGTDQYFNTILDGVRDTPIIDGGTPPPPV